MHKFRRAFNTFTITAIHVVPMEISNTTRVIGYSMKVEEITDETLDKYIYKRYGHLICKMGVESPRI